jgi:hypothetical protein
LCSVVSNRRVRRERPRRCRAADGLMTSRRFTRDRPENIFAAPPNNGGPDHSEAVPNAALTALRRGARLGANKSNVRRAVLARMQSLGGTHETPKQFP